MRIEAKAFGEQALELVCVVGKLREALRLEELLTSKEIDYVVQTGAYRSGFLIHTEKVGAFFYVPAEGAEACRELLHQHGYRAEPPAHGVAGANAAGD